MNSSKKNKKAEMFSRNEVEVKKIREIRVIHIIRDSDKEILVL